ncbi:MAG: alpha/beta hydrolase [Chloroflexota bacterium]
MRRSTSVMITSDNMSLHTIQWLPASEKKPRALVLLVHGIAEHCGRYQHVAQALTEADYAVFGLDHRGHGRSDGRRSLIRDFDKPVTDLAQYMQHFRAQHPDQKVFVFGHSMGALIGLLFALKYQAELAGFISQGTPLNLDEKIPRLLLPLAKIVTRALGDFRSIPIQADDLSRDPAVVAAYQEDPLVDTRWMRAGVVLKLLQTGQQARKQLESLHLPLLILHGTADTICPISGSRTLHEHAASADKTLITYENAFHELHNEPDQAQVLHDILSWLNQH